MTQSNAVPLIRLHGSCLAQGRCAPRKGLALPHPAQMTEFRALHSKHQHEPRQLSWMLLLPTPTSRPQSQQSRIHFCVHSAFGTAEH